MLPLEEGGGERTIAVGDVHNRGLAVSAHPVEELALGVGLACSGRDAAAEELTRRSALRVQRIELHHDLRELLQAHCSTSVAR